jgi:hypothetical protein
MCNKSHPSIVQRGHFDGETRETWQRSPALRPEPQPSLVGASFVVALEVDWREGMRAWRRSPPEDFQRGWCRPLDRPHSPRGLAQESLEVTALE